MRICLRLLMRFCAITLSLLCLAVVGIGTVSAHPSANGSAIGRKSNNITTTTHTFHASAEQCAANKRMFPAYAQNPDICTYTLTETAIIVDYGTSNPSPNSVCVGSCDPGGCVPLSSPFQVTLIDQYTGPAHLWSVEQDATFSGNKCDTPSIVPGTHDCNIYWAVAGISISNTYCTDYANNDGGRVAQANYSISGYGITSTQRIYATMPWQMWNWTFTHNP